MIDCGNVSEAVTDFAECAVCWTDTRLRCADCGEPVCQSCQVCPNACETRMRPSIGAWMVMPLALPAIARRAS